MVTKKNIIGFVGILITIIFVGGGYYMLSCHWMEIPDEAQYGIILLITGFALLVVIIFLIKMEGVKKC